MIAASMSEQPVYLRRSFGEEGGCLAMKVICANPTYLQSMQDITKRRGGLMRMK
jgi:hypothetical protein